MLSKKDMQAFLAEEEAKLAQDLELVSDIKNQAKTNSIKKILTGFLVVISIFITTAYNIGSEYDREKVRKYKEAQLLQEKEMYQDAIDVYDKLYGYASSDSNIRTCENLLKELKTKKVYENAMAFFNDGKYKEAAILFGNVKEYENAADKYKESYYKYGQECVTAKEYENAYYAFNNASGYLDAKELAATYKFATTSVGFTIEFGKYEQDNNASNGPEDIVWYVLYKEEDKMLLISKYVLDTMAFDENYQISATTSEPYTYANSTIRTFVNETFYNAAFTDEEKEKIVPLKIVEKISEEKIVESENNVFLPTYETVEEYVVKLSSKRTAYGTKAALNRTSTQKTSWWTCSINTTGTQVVTVNSNGVISNGSLNSVNGIRPAIWVDFVK